MFKVFRLFPYSNPTPHSTFMVMLIFLTLFALYPLLNNPHINSGQLLSQITEVTHAQSFADKTNFLIFPFKKIIDLSENFAANEFSQNITPVRLWAGDSVIYPIILGKLNRFTNIDMTLLGRLLSFISYLILILTGWIWGKKLARPHQSQLFFHPNLHYAPTILPLLLALYPVFRLYSISVMPDMSLATLTFLSLFFYYQRKRKLALFILSLSTLLRSFSVFLILGLFIFEILSKNKKYKFYLYFILSLIPLSLYYFLVYYFQVPSTLFQSFFEHSQISILLKFEFWQRIFTWLALKNSTPMGFFLSVMGFIFILSKRKVYPKFLTWPLGLILGQVIFICTSPGEFYSFDYYPIITMLIFILLATAGLNNMLVKCSKKKWLPPQVMLIFIMSLIFSFSIPMTFKSQIPHPFFPVIGKIISQQTSPQDKILVVGDHGTEIPLYESNREGWILKINKIQSMTKVQREILLNLFKNGAIQTILIFDSSKSEASKLELLKMVNPEINLDDWQLTIEDFIEGNGKKISPVYYQLFTLTLNK
jgi:hypothetical protein